MYLSTTRAGAAAPATPTTGPGRGRVPGTVLALGMVSFVTDISAEMVTAVLPMYLMYGIGLGYLQLGLLDGLYTGASALLRLGGGYVADRFSRAKAVAVTGYGLSALTKLALPLAGTSMAGIGLAVGVDRAGKGIRTAPRDALITLSTPADGLGRAFGVHRTMDTAGALLGPIVAFGLLAAVLGGYDLVFGASFGFAVIGVLILVFFVRRPAPVSGARRGTLRAGLTALARPRLRRTCFAAGLLGLVTVGDMFLYLAIQQRIGLAPTVLPLLPLGTAVTFMLAATPAGRLADRVGRWRLFLGGHVLLLGGYLVLVGPFGGWPAALAVLGLHGLFYAATDGVLMALAGQLVPAEVRATGLAVVQTVQAVARAGGAVLFGIMAQLTAPTTAFGFLAAALCVAIAVAAPLGARGRDR
ncbi:MFS transporter [Amycolatopsis cihanbeyliensis]|uniref:Sugar phosphate permease n=1 Tax=Amycolatopsis cihanbeyliensis TaxID=1128664 RepID=A0A542DQK2_AMYCI|nr:MFS transporter [Amycolatopsis cihanbeyliensis]TQJ05337.1 sugar phosphate permease [Amycolatopsis cihanbeyliensis]